MGRISREDMDQEIRLKLNLNQNKEDYRLV